MSVIDISSSEKIRRLNDEFRRTFFSGWVVVTSGVMELGPDSVMAASLAVKAYDTFTEENDPYEEHDFGSFMLGKDKLFWKISYYDNRLEYGSEDPSDPRVTTRVLKIMLANEY